MHIVTLYWNKINYICKIECSGPDHNQLEHRKNKKLSNVAELKYVQMHYGFPADILDFFFVNVNYKCTNGLSYRP